MIRRWTLWWPVCAGKQVCNLDMVEVMANIKARFGKDPIYIKKVSGNSLREILNTAEWLEGLGSEWAILDGFLLKALLWVFLPN